MPEDTLSFMFYYDVMPVCRFHSNNFLYENVFVASTQPVKQTRKSDLMQSARLIDNRYREKLPFNPLNS
jgi:hypothetical protein